MPPSMMDSEQSRSSFWQTGSFMGTGGNELANFALDALVWDVARDAPVGAFSVLGWKLNVPGVNKFWMKGAGGAFADKILEDGASWANEAARKAASSTWSWERVASSGRFSSLVDASKTGWYGFGSKATRTASAEYAGARLGSRMGWEFMNPARWFDKTIPWSVKAMGAGAAFSNVAGTFFRLSFGAPAMGFNVGMMVKNAYTSAMIEQGSAHVGRMTRVDMAPTFYDSREAATMRQAAMQEIQNTQLNLRSAFGREASMIHR